MLFRVTAVDRLGNASSAFTRMFRLSPSFFLIPPTLKVLLDFTPPLPGVLTPPLGVRLTVEEVPFQELPLGFNALTNRSVVPPILAGYNVYRAALPNGGQALPGVQQILDPTNLVGSIDIDATSFADIVGTNRGDNFAYSITTFLGDEQISGGSQPVSTDLPVIIKPIWDKKTIFMQARGSFIAREGAVLIVNDQESFPLEIDDSGEFFKVSKNTGSSPSDRKIKKLVKKGRETFLRVRNPDGRESVLKTLKRF
jgi:hypothetical protein